MTLYPGFGVSAEHDTENHSNTAIRK